MERKPRSRSKVTKSGVSVFSNTIVRLWERSILLVLHCLEARSEFVDLGVLTCSVSSVGFR